MLVLSRKNGQKIIINNDIEITILESKFDNCKIAISAPREVTIYREEVYKQIQLSNKMSNKTSVDSIESLTSLVNEVKETTENKEKTNKIIIVKKK
jgi:carbon storage regulator